MAPVPPAGLLLAVAAGYLLLAVAVWLVTRWSTQGPPAAQEHRYQALLRAHVGPVLLGAVGVLLLAAIVWRVRQGP